MLDSNQKRIVRTEQIKSKKMEVWKRAFHLSVAFTLLSLVTTGCTLMRRSPVVSEGSTDWVAEGTFTTGIEGPAVGPDGTLYAVNFARQGTIGQVSEQGEASLFIALPKGSTGNGIRFLNAETLLVADYTGHNILRVNRRTGSVSVFAHEPRMNQPNDIAIAPNGQVYASDPDWRNSSGQLWRIDQDAYVHLLEASMGTTNGVEVSPDGKRLYVNESVQKAVYVYDIAEGGALQNKRELIRFDEHGLDGMRCDEKGNLYIARYGAGNIAVVSPEGELLETVLLTGQHPTNVAFGGPDGRTVFVTMQRRGAIEKFKSRFRGRDYFLVPK